jgi:preprotein translocase subunit SecE
MKKQSHTKLLWVVALIAFVVAFVGSKNGLF